MWLPVALHVVTLLLVQGKPDGYYHQEAEYHSSAASYKNNELQRQNQDDGFYTAHGDLGLKTKPKVNSYSQHSEYVNPKLRNAGNAQSENFDTSGFTSNSDQQDRYLAGYTGSSHGQNAFDTYNQGQSAYRGYQSSALNRASTSYGAASNLEDLTRQLQTDLSRQLQNAISNQYRESSSYSHSASSSSTQMQQDIRDLEEELKANLTRRLQEVLYQQYGQQRTQGPYSYSSTNDGLRSTANYNNQELNNLKQEVENNLLRQLQQGVRAQYSTHENRNDSFSSFRSHSSDSQRQESNVPTYGRLYPNLPLSSDSHVQPGYQPHRVRQYPHRQPEEDSSYSNSNIQSSSYRQTLTTIGTTVQNDLSEQINEILEEQERENNRLIRLGIKPNYDSTLDDLRADLKRNITQQLRNELRRNYGDQDRTGSYSYPGSSGSTPRYSAEDVENMIQQIQDNLFEKLSYGIRQQKSRYDEQRAYYVNSQRQSTSNSYAHGNVNYPTTHSNSYNSDQRRYDTTGYYQTDNPQPVIPLSSGSQTSSGSYRHLSRTQTSGYEVSPNSEAELRNIKQQLQDQLSRQLQFAIREEKKQINSYSSSGSTPNYQTTLQELTDELKRNLTEKLQQALAQTYRTQRTMGSQSFSVASSGSLRSNANYNVDQLNDVTQELQDNLIRQLQEGLRQSWNRGQSSSSFVKNGHSSYSAYGAAGGYASSRQVQRNNQFGSQGQVQSDTYDDEDCMQGDDNFDRSNHEDQTSPSRGDIGVSSQKQTQSQEDDLTQKTENNFMGQATSQERDNTDDLTQKTEDDFEKPPSYGFGRLYSGQVKPKPQTQNQYRNIQQTQDDLDGLTQKTEEFENVDDLTQKTENEFAQHQNYGFGRLHNTQAKPKQEIANQFTSISQTQENFAQHTETNERQHVNAFNRQYEFIPKANRTQKVLRNNNQYHPVTNYDHDLTQKTENGFDGLETLDHRLDNPNQKQDLVQQATANFTKFKHEVLADLAQKRQRSDESENSSSEDLLQRTVDNKYNRLRQPSYYSQRQQSSGSQENDSSESSEGLVQRTVENKYDRLQQPSQRQQSSGSYEKDSSERFEDSVQRIVDNKHDRLEQPAYFSHRQQSSSSQEKDSGSESSEDLVQRTVNNKYDRFQQPISYHSQTQHRQDSQNDSNEHNLNRRLETPSSRYDLTANSQHRDTHQFQEKNSSDIVQNTANSRSYQSSYDSSHSEAHSDRQEKFSSYSQASSDGRVVPMYTHGYGMSGTTENFETADDLVQKPIKPARAYEVQDVSDQALNKQFEVQNEDEHLIVPEETSTVELQTDTSPRPGFWKKLGNKIENAYTSVKHYVG